ncbi:MAG: methylenetetrahydrofolate reductase, partial [Oceanipulchritudo sp.]
ATTAAPPVAAARAAPGATRQGSPGVADATQLFYDNTNFLRWAQGCRENGIEAPLIPGLMPIRSAKQARRFCEHIPDELSQALDEAGDDPEKTQEVGIDWTTRQVTELFEAGYKAVHLYIMNRSGAAVEVIRRLRQNGAI